MPPEVLLDNLLPWIVQVSAVSLLGTVLPLLFSLRHPRTQLRFGYLVLLACLVLPLVQPKRIPTTTTTVRTHTSPGARVALTPTSPAVSRETGSNPTPASGPLTASANEVDDASAVAIPRDPGAVSQPWPVRWFLFWVLVAGALFRLARLALGAWQIRRYRVAATPFFPVPDSIAQAAARIRTRALVCLSSDVSSPATIGVWRPVVLLPDSFNRLEPSAQEAVACHELLHVRRLDWLKALIEGVIGALLWFTPVSWLISEIRLAREQVVDEEVVRLTAAKESYIRALLDIARARPSMEIVPAPLFIRRRHLTARVHLLLDGAAGSLRRLSVCYASISALLIAGGWAAVALFPLVGLPRVVEAAPAARVSTLPAPVVPTAPSPAAEPVTAAAAAAAVEEPDPWSEPFVGAIDIARTPSARAAALGLLERARQNSDLHIPGTPSFHLEVSFEAFGQARDTGAGVLSETWISGQRWRWTANLGGYSQIRIGSGNSGFDVAPVSSVPSRVHMLRRIIFSPVRVPEGAKVRVAAGRAGRSAVTCILLGPPNAPSPPDRLWQEEEYCVDEAGLLRVFSPAPGVYTQFDYSRQLHFGGRVLPGSLRTFLGGTEVIQAQLTVRAAGDLDDPQLTATPDMIRNGIGLPLVALQRVLLRAPAPDAAGDESVAIVHVTIDRSGVVAEAEAAFGDPRVTQAAVDHVRAHRFPDTGTQRDAYVGVRFGTATVTH